MADISTIDKNFIIETKIEREGIKFYDVKSSAMKLYGVWHDGEVYRRVPKDVAENTSTGVAALATHTAGGHIRFITDSPYVILKVVFPKMSPMNHMPLSGSAGFDMYVREGVRERYIKSFIPPRELSFEGVCDFSEKKERLLTVNFPLYNDVAEVYIGLHEAAKLASPTPYDVELPMVSYGSSITQGGCASRPGNSYQAMISRRYNADYINLGFSGSAKGEDAMRDYIASLPMSAFIFDYDFNAPTPDHLRATHLPIYEAVRAANPDIPIVMMARPCFNSSRGIEIRNEIVRATYEYAVKNGDTRVRFIDSVSLMEIAEDNGTVDGTHPTDLGFYSMAKRVERELDDFFAVISEQT